jgi:hypothetical protein
MGGVTDMNKTHTAIIRRIPVAKFMENIREIFAKTPGVLICNCGEDLWSENSILHHYHQGCFDVVERIGAIA